MNGTICPTCGAKMPMMTDGKHYVCTLCGDGWIFEHPSSQLCPNEDCAWHIVPAWDRQDKANWYQCGHCERVLWAEPADGDFEDWHAWTSHDWLMRTLEHGKHPEPYPDKMPIAFALNSSWASPELAKWDRKNET